MEKVLKELGQLQLDNLDNDWVQAVYYSEFLEFNDFPAKYESVLESLDIRSLFRSIMKALKSWLSTGVNENKDVSWQTLSPHVNHQRLLAVLAYYIDYGTKNVLTKGSRNNALLACRLYYKLLAVPGYKAYHIYHSQLFAHSLACLGYPKALCDSEDNYFNTRELTCEVNSLVKELQLFVMDLRAIIEALQLNPSDMNFEDILSNLVDVTGCAIVNKLNIDKIELSNITRVIYEIIDILICDAGGEPNSSAIRLLFKCILPKLVAASVDSRNANNLVRASYVTYSGLLLTKYGKAALNGYTVLLQHLCYTLDGLERAEVRNARVSLIFGMMSMLPRKSYRNTVKWLLQLSTTAKVSHRHIAMEMICKLLSNEPENKNAEQKPPDEKDPNQKEPNEADPNQNPQAETDAPTDQNTETSTDDAQKESGENDQLPVATAPSTEDESSQELPVSKDEDMTEEEMAGLLRQRPHRVPHAELLRAVYARVHDLSSTLRTRALNILTDCALTTHGPMREAVDELNGSGTVSRLMAVAARAVCDERACVRRAAVPLVRSVLSDVPVPADLGILVGLCRDASIIVRSAAIGALGEIACQNPSEATLDAFLSGPMHQLSDPETKVQEQVVTLIQQMLFDRLKTHSRDVLEDPLPWMFLAGITRHNMRRHLQKACALLAKTGSCINHRGVDIVSTHVGSVGSVGSVGDARDLHCLVLLTSVARHVQYSNVGFVLDYYYTLAESDRDRDIRLTSLTLELLHTWSRYASAVDRNALRQSLVRRLASSPQDACRIACASLAADLDPDNLQWATELMQIAERQALNGGSVEECLRAADLSLIAPTPPSPGLFRVFLQLITEPPSDCSEEMMGSAVAGLGRLCVRSRSAAQACAPALAALLPRAEAPLRARVNALLALTDICTRYTCIVEPLLESVCGCVSTATHAQLRRAAASALTRLLLAGYLRLRTPLYYTYCALLADSDHDVREPAEYYVTCCLTPDAIYHHFVDCIVHYNKQHTDPISFDHRQLIYDVMLQRLSLVQKLNVQCRLAREILEHAADLTDEGDGELPAELNAALLDTITLLCGPRMKLPKKPQAAGDAADIDDLQERVTTNIVSHKMKRTVAEVLVPAVLRLYSRLRPRGGQVAAYLVRIATDLLNDYRQEIEELIENDEELIERVQQFQETIGIQVSFGNSRNLVTTSAPPEPETPKSTRKRPTRTPRDVGSRKRALKI